MTYTIKNGQKLLVRPALVCDAQQCIDLMLTADSETKFLGRNVGEFQMTVEQEEKYIEKVRQNPKHIFLVAEIGGEIVGSCSASAVRNSQRFVHRATIGILVKRNFWGQGIGTTLLNELVQEAKTQGYEQLELDVVNTNDRAIALYEKFGFEPVGRLPHSLKYPDGSYADSVLMVKIL